jgi:hypothetical protein
MLTEIECEASLNTFNQMKQMSEENKLKSLGKLRMCGRKLHI